MVPNRCQAITWTNAVSTSEWFNEMQSEKNFHSRKFIWKCFLWNVASVLMGQLWFTNSPCVRFIILRLRQNGRHFADNIFESFFLNQNYCIFIKISLKYVPEGSVNNMSSFAQVMAWHCLGYKPLPELKMNKFIDTYASHSLIVSYRCPVSLMWLQAI